MDKIETQKIQVSERSIVYGVLFIVFLAMLYYLRELVYVFLTSIVIASFVESAVRRFHKHGVRRTIAVMIIYFLVLLICGGLLYLFIPVFLSQFGQFSSFIDKYLPATTSLGTTDGFNVSNIFQNFQSLASGETGGALQTAIALFGGLFNFVILIVLSFYLSINDKGIETFLRIVTPARYSDYAVDLWYRTERKIGLWFQGQLLLALLVGVLIYLGLLIFNVQYSLLLALLAAVMELIPFGIILASIPAIAAGFSGHSATGAFEVAGLYLIVHQFELNLISPLIVQKVVGVSSLMVVLSLLVGLKLAGFWGVVLAIPATVLLMEFLADVKKKKGLPI
ncbi:MAG: AI-2E family transporter [bacterium]